MKKTNNLVQLAVLGFFAIGGIVFIIIMGIKTINANLTLSELERTTTPFISEDFDPCAEIKCSQGVYAHFAGQQEIRLTELPDPLFNTVCQCPNGKTFITRAYTPKRFL